MAYCQEERRGGAHEGPSFLHWLCLTGHGPIIRKFREQVKEPAAPVRATERFRNRPMRSARLLLRAAAPRLRRSLSTRSTVARRRPRRAASRRTRRNQSSGTAWNMMWSLSAAAQRIGGRKRLKQLEEKRRDLRASSRRRRKSALMLSPVMCLSRQLRRIAPVGRRRRPRSRPK